MRGSIMRKIADRSARLGQDPFKCVCPRMLVAVGNRDAARWGIRKLNTSLDDYVIGYPPHPIERMQAFFFGTAIFPGRHRSCAAPRNVAVRADRNRRSYFRRVLVCICHGNGSEAMERNRTWRGLRVLLKRPIFRSIAVGLRMR